jgi:hypothetical protein
VLPHLPTYSPDLAPADFFLFRKMNEELAGLHLTQESLKNAWEGVVTITFRRWLSNAKNIFGSAETVLRKVEKYTPS